MDTFMSNLQRTALSNNNVAYSENGARMYGTAGKALLDLNFSVSAMRDMDPILITEKFLAAFKEDPTLATKWLFYARDIREGLGERRLFNLIFRYLSQDKPMMVRRLVKYIPEYGRWDDLLELIDTKLEKDAFRTIARQFGKDLNGMKANKPISLLGKWMPSIATTSAMSRHQALKLSRYIGISIPAYRKLVSKLRKYIDVLEVKMSNNQWDQIDYSKVPSRANLVYSKAFLRHDPERRLAFLEAAMSGNAKMNSSALYPHEIVSSYIQREFWYWGYQKITSVPEDPVVEALWNNLPQIPSGSRTIVVQDGSESMVRQVSSSSSVRCIDVAIGLALYFAQNLTGPYANRVITFSEHPQFVDLNGYDTLAQKVSHLAQYQEVANTNIEAVFALILQTAIDNQLTQEELPDNILIISDMEFDSCVVGRRGYGGPNPNLFEEISQSYAANGYKLPRVCFWNTMGRSGVVPMVQNDLGCALMSGFSINNAKLIMSGKTDPYEVLLDVLNSERYADIYLGQYPDDCSINY